MVVDSFIFFNEFDLLEVRLHELYPVVDKFILVESTHTHSGIEKPLYFKENKERYSTYSDKIIHVIYDAEEVSKDGNPIENTRAWVNEKGQRKEIYHHIDFMSEDDILLVSDLDEIPNRKSILSLKLYDREKFPLAYSQDFFYYDYTSYKGKWSGTKVFKKDQITSANVIDSTRNFLTPNRAKEFGFNVIEGGWHMSFFFDQTGLAEKIKSFAHQEFNDSQFLERIEKALFGKEDVFGRGWEKITYKPFSDNLPLLIKDRVNSEYADDVILAIATHRRKYLDSLLGSLKILPYQKIVSIDQKRVGSNLSQVWEMAKSTGKRYVVLMDDDIEVLEKDIVWRSINVMKMKGWAIAGPHETYNPNYRLGKHLFKVYDKEWLPGYFLVIDTHLIGDYVFDTCLNDNEDHVDIDMCMHAHSKGYKVGVVDRVIVHYTDNHLPENQQIMRADGHSQYFMAHDNLKKKWSMPSPLVPGKSVYESTYIKSKNVYSSIE